jgi:hypothetical protein
MNAGRVLKFTVPGKAVGYYTSGARPNWTRLKSYRAYKQAVQWAAKAAGLRLPLMATEAAPVFVTTRLFCRSRVHHDPENVHKGIVDALFYGAKGGDKHVGGTFWPARYGEREAVKVAVERRVAVHPEIEDRQGQSVVEQRRPLNGERAPAVAVRIETRRPGSAPQTL